MHNWPKALVRYPKVAIYIESIRDKVMYMSELCKLGWLPIVIWKIIDWSLAVFIQTVVVNFVDLALEETLVWDEWTCDTATLERTKKLISIKFWTIVEACTGLFIEWIDFGSRRGVLSNIVENFTEFTVMNVVDYQRSKADSVLKWRCMQETHKWV